MSPRPTAVQEEVRQRRASEIKAIGNRQNGSLENRKEILIDGRFYDVTKWSKLHPGGKVINYYTESGEDATIPFQQFHHRSTKRVFAIKNALSSRLANQQELGLGLDSKAAERQKSLAEGFKKLHEEFLSQGLYNPSLFHVITRVAEFFFYLLAALLILRNHQTGLFLRAFGILLLTAAYGRVVWLAHEGGHYSLTGNTKADLILQSFLYGFGNGLSASWWNHNHSRHHSMPQRIKRDVDLDTLPLIAFTTKACNNDFKLGQNWFIKHQSILFLPFHSFVVSFRWMLDLHPRYCYYKSLNFQLVCMALHYTIIPQIGLLNFLIAKWLWSMYMFGNFSLSHTHLEVADSPRHWVEFALHHTINIHPNWFTNWWMGYLNYQIEHHLFPTMPQFRNPLISERVRQFAQDHSLSYKVLGYGEALLQTLNNLHEVSNELHSHSD